jgi:hypothetical protein
MTPPVTRSGITRNNQVMSRCGQAGRVDYAVSFSGTFTLHLPERTAKVKPLYVLLEPGNHDTVSLTRVKIHSLLKG